MTREIAASAGRVAGFCRISPAGVSVAVRVEPKSRRPGLQGVAASGDGQRLRIGVSVAPEQGRANHAACAALALALHVPASRVSVAIGGTRREKTLLVSSPDSADAARLLALLAGPMLDGNSAGRR